MEGGRGVFVTVSACTHTADLAAAAPEEKTQEPWLQTPAGRALVLNLTAVGGVPPTLVKFLRSRKELR